MASIVSFILEIRMLKLRQTPAYIKNMWPGRATAKYKLYGIFTTERYPNEISFQ